MRLLVLVLATFSMAISAKEILLKVKDLDALKTNSHYKIIEKFSLSTGNYIKVEINSKTFNNSLKSLKKNSNILKAEENVIYKAFDYEESSPSWFYKQWYLSNQGNNEPVTIDQMSPMDGKVGCDINALNAWEISKGSKDIKIAILDTGVDYNHPKIKDNIWVNDAELNGKEGVDDDHNGFVDDIRGYDFANNDNDPMDDKGHGTHCSGIMAASHTKGKIKGVLDQASIIPVKFLDKDGFGDLDVTIKALDYAIKLNPDVISCSWGSSMFSDILLEMIKKAKDKGIIIVAAAGNFRGRNNDVTPTYPASYKSENVISVSAHNAQTGHSHFSTFGPNSVHLSAPGTNIISTWPNNEYKVTSGTSMSTPIVAASVGLYKYLYPEATPLEVRNMIMATAIPEKRLEGKSITGARLDLYRFIEHITE